MNKSRKLVRLIKLMENSNRCKSCKKRCNFNESMTRSEVEYERHLKRLGYEYSDSYYDDDGIEYLKKELGNCKFSTDEEFDDDGGDGSYYAYCKVLKIPCTFTTEENDQFNCPLSSLMKRGDLSALDLCDETFYDKSSKNIYCKISEEQCIYFPDYNSIVEATKNYEGKKYSPYNKEYPFYVEEICPIKNKK